MVDPITALATATALFNGVKQAVKIGQEAEEIFGQLAKWAGAVSDVQFCLEQGDKKPPLFAKLSFADDTQKALGLYQARVKLKQMEDELYHLFHYGELSWLGRDGYLELIQIRRDVKAKREAMLYRQARARKEFVDAVASWSLGLLLIGVGVAAVWFTASIIANKGL